MTTEDAASLRRRLDQEMAENQRADRARLDAMLSRMGGMETALNRLTADYEQVRRQTLTVQEQQTHIIERLTEFSARFVAHVDDEAAERTILRTIAETITQHGERISFLDRLLWAVIGAGGVGAASAVGWALSHVQGVAAH